MKPINAQIQEAQWTPNRKKIKIKTSRENLENKKLKSRQRKKAITTYTGQSWECTDTSRQEQWKAKDKEDAF